MSDISSGLITLLEADAAVGAIVGTNEDAKIYPDDLPQGVIPPAIVVDEFASTHAHQLSGAAGVYFPRVRLDCYEATAALARTLAEAVRDALQGFRGSAGSEFVKSCELDGRVKDKLEQRDKSDRAFDRVRLSFRLVVDESIPTF